MTATAFDARVNGRRPLHPLRAFLLAGSVPLFLGVLLSDIAYANSDRMHWQCRPCCLWRGTATARATPRPAALDEDR